MKTNQITEEIKHYVDNDFTEQALFLNGDWGIGKSYYIKNVLPKELKSINCLYLSLYGVNGIDEIDKFLFLNLHHLAKFAGDTAKSIGEAPTYLLKKLTGSLLSKFNIDLKDFDYLSSIDPSMALLILDDFERSSIPTLEILGYINNLCENYNLKVLVVGNEGELHFDKDETSKVNKYNFLISLNNLIGNELEDLSDEKLSELSNNFFSQRSLYNVYKEKTISKTIVFDTDISDAISSIIDNIPKDYKCLKGIVMKNKAFYIQNMEKESNYNLRTFKYYLDLFNRIFVTLTPLQKESYFNELLMIIAKSLYFMTFMSIHKKTVFSDIDKKDENENQMFFQNDGYIHFKIISDYIVNDKLDSDYFVRYFKTFGEKLKLSAKADLNIIENYVVKSDLEVTQAIKNIIEKLEKNQINYVYFRRILYHFSVLYKIGFHEAKLEDTCNIMITSLKSLDNIDFDYIEDKYYGFDISDEKIEVLNSFEDFILKCKKEKMRSIVNDIMESSDWGSKILNLYRNKKNDFIDQGLFLKFFSLTLLEQKIIEGNPSCLRDFFTVLKKIYNVESFSLRFDSDRENLYKLIKMISNKKNKDRISQAIINYYVNYFNDGFKKKEKEETSSSS